MTSNNDFRVPGRTSANGHVRASSTTPAGQRNLRDYVLMVQERWLVGFIGAAIVVGVLAGYQLRQPEIFEASATLMFEETNPRVVDIQEVVDTSLHVGSEDSRLQTHIEQVKSASFFRYVAATLSEEEADRIRQSYLRPDDRLPEGWAPPLADIILPGIDATLNRGTYILTVSARHRDPEAAALIANRYAEKYIEFNRERASTGTVAAVAFLKEQAQELLVQVQESEDALQAYRREHNLVSLEESQNIIVRRLNSLSASAIDARVARLALDTQLDHVESHLTGEKDLLSVDYIAEYGSVNALRVRLDELEAQRAILGERYLENHPRMIENTRAIDNVQTQLAENIAMAVAELRSRHRRVVNHEAKLETELAEAENRSLGLEEVAIRYHVLRRRAEADRQSYARIVDRLNETTIASALENINIKMVDTADRPFRPVEPNLQKIVLQSAFLGCFLFLVLPLGLGLLDQKLKAAWEIEFLLKLPLLGEIPRLNSLKKRDRPHIISQGQAHAACEAFRGIFSQLQLNSPINAPRAILLTSTVPGEGKSIVSSNLAATFATHGKRTLLVDCDFRRPALHFYYERKNDRGIIRWLEMDEPGKDPLQPDEALDILPLGHKLHLLRAGGESRNPTEMFNQPDFRALFEQLKEQYDVLLIDTPPVGIFPDALMLAPLCDQILYVCQFNRVNKTQIRKFMDKLETAKVEIGGLILNGIPSGRTSTYYDYFGYGQVGNKEYKAYYAQKR